MTQPSYDVVEAVTMQLISSDASVIPVNAEFSFRVSDPYTVRTVFTGQHTMSTWLLGRELLVHGRRLPDQGDMAPHLLSLSLQVVARDARVVLHQHPHQA